MCALVLARATPESRRMCEEQRCTKEVMTCSRDPSCLTFATCQRDCPADSSECLSRCALAFGLIPSRRSVALVNSLIRCAARQCRDHFSDPGKCGPDDIKTLVSAARQCAGVNVERCPSQGCADTIFAEKIMQKWFHCQHNPAMRDARRGPWLRIARAIIACEAYTVPGCRDSPRGWKDHDGDTCMDYVDKRVCANGALNIDISDLMTGCSYRSKCVGTYGRMANEACCACGGGQRTPRCASDEAADCISRFKNVGCDSTKLGFLPTVCDAHTDCLRRACAVVPVAAHSAMVGVLRCGAETTHARVVFTETKAEKILAVLSFDGKVNTSLSRSAQRSGRSKRPCSALGWDMAKRANEEVTFKDKNGDVNSYRQTPNGIVLYVAHHMGGKGAPQGLVRQFYFDNKTGLLQDSYGPLRIPEKKRAEILRNLARMARVNGIPGLESFYVPDPACMSSVMASGLCRVADYDQAHQICKSIGARLCSADELSQLNDPNQDMCGRGRVRSTWTHATCNDPPAPGEQPGNESGDPPPPNAWGNHVTVQRPSMTKGVWMSREAHAAAAGARCYPDTRQASVACCADQPKNKLDYLSGGATLAVTGRYQPSQRTLTLTVGNWVTPPSGGGSPGSDGYSPRPAVLTGRVSSDGTSLRGQHSLCAGGTFVFSAARELVGPSGNFSRLGTGECRCQDALEAPSADVDARDVGACVDWCASDEQCMAIAFATPGIPGSAGFCRLYLRSAHAREGYRNVRRAPTARKDKKKSAQRRCEIARVDVDPATAPRRGGTCYVRQSSKTTRVPPKVSTSAPLLACALRGGRCEEQMEACRLETMCLRTLMCAAEKDCADGQCFRACRDNPGQGLGSDAPTSNVPTVLSPEIKALSSCISESGCDVARGTGSGSHVGHASDIPAGHLRLGFPLTASREIISALQGNTKGFARDFVDDLVDALHENADRFAVVSTRAPIDQGPVTVVFDILESNLDLRSSQTGLESTNDDIFKRLDWMTASRNEQLVGPERKWTRFLAGNIFKISAAQRDAAQGWPADSARAAGWTGAAIGAIVGAAAVTLAAALAIRFRKRLFLTRIVGLRVRGRPRDTEFFGSQDPAGDDVQLLRFRSVSRRDRDGDGDSYSSGAENEA